MLLFRSPELRHHMFSVFPDWPGGIYGTPTVAGSRSGALVAVTWAALMVHGVEGYTAKTRAIVDTTRTIAAGIAAIPGLRLMCPPETSVVSWTSEDFDIYRLVEPFCHQRGWDIGVLQFPSGMHLAVTLVHTQPGVADKFLQDLAETTARVRSTPGGKVGVFGKHSRTLFMGSHSARALLRWRERALCMAPARLFPTAALLKT